MTGRAAFLPNGTVRAGARLPCSLLCRPEDAMSGDGRERSQDHLPKLRLDELLGELQVRIDAVRGTRDRLHSLLEAVLFPFVWGI